MDRIDGFLSNIAQTIDVTALVVCDEAGNGETWYLKREGKENIGLGNTFHRAQAAVRAWVKSQARAKAGKDQESR